MRGGGGGDGLLTNREAGLGRGERSNLRLTESDSNMEGGIPCS